MNLVVVELLFAGLSVSLVLMKNCLFSLQKYKRFQEVILLRASIHPSLYLAAQILPVIDLIQGYSSSFALQVTWTAEVLS